MNTEIEKATEKLKIAEGRTALLKEISKGCQALASDRDEDLGKVSGYDLAYLLAEIRSKVEQEEKAACIDLDFAHYQTAKSSVHFRS